MVSTEFCGENTFCAPILAQRNFVLRVARLQNQNGNIFSGVRLGNQTQKQVYWCGTQLLRGLSLRLPESACWLVVFLQQVFP